MKKVILFILLLLPWYLSSLIPFNLDFYNQLTLPFFTPPRLFFPIAWNIVYVCITIGLYLIFTNYRPKDIPKSFYRILILNYLFNQLFMVFFSVVQSTFLSFVTATFTFITTLFLYEETNDLHKKSTKYLNPYVLLSLFATVLSLTIYILNV